MGESGRRWLVGWVGGWVRGSSSLASCVYSNKRLENSWEEEDDDEDDDEKKD